MVNVKYRISIYHDKQYYHQCFEECVEHDANKGHKYYWNAQYYLESSLKEDVEAIKSIKSKTM